MRIPHIACLAFVALALVACGTNPTPDAADARDAAPPSRLELEPSHAMLAAGVCAPARQDFRAWIVPPTGERLALSSVDVTWSIDDPRIASVDGLGMVTPLARGTTVLHVRYAGVQNLTARATIEVSEPAQVPMCLLAITPANATASINQTQPFTAIARWADGSSRDVTREAMWFSSDPASLEIAAGGTARPVGGGCGFAQVYAVFASERSNSATVSWGGTHYASTEVAPARISLTPAGHRCAAIESPVVVRARYVDWRDAILHEAPSGVEWTSSASSVVEVSNDPTTLGQLRPGARDGAARLVATFCAAMTPPAEVVIESRACYTALRVMPAALRLRAGETARVQAAVTLDDGTTADLTDGVVWTLPARAPARVSAVGEIYVPGGDYGTFELTATRGGLSATATLTIDP